MEEQKQVENTKNKTGIVAVLVVVIVAVAIFFILNSKGGVQNNNSSRETKQQEETAETKPTQVIENLEKGKNVSLYEIKAENGELNPKEITVKIGEPVAFVLRAIDADYSVKVSYPDLPILKAKKGDASSALIFTPEKTGAFSFECISCSGAGEKAKGVFIVK